VEFRRHLSNKNPWSRFQAAVNNCGSHAIDFWKFYNGEDSNPSTVNFISSLPIHLDSDKFNVVKITSFAELLNLIEVCHDQEISISEFLNVFEDWSSHLLTIDLFRSVCVPCLLCLTPFIFTMFGKAYSSDVTGDGPVQSAARRASTARAQATRLRNQELAEAEAEATIVRAAAEAVATAEIARLLAAAASAAQQPPPVLPLTAEQEQALVSAAALAEALRIADEAEQAAALARAEAIRLSSVPSAGRTASGVTPSSPAGRTASGVTPTSPRTSSLQTSISVAISELRLRSELEDASRLEAYESEKAIAAVRLAEELALLSTPPLLPFTLNPNAIPFGTSSSASAVFTLPLGYTVVLVPYPNPLEVQTPYPCPHGMCYILREINPVSSSHLSSYDDFKYLTADPLRLPLTLWAHVPKYDPTKFDEWYQAFKLLLPIQLSAITKSVQETGKAFPPSLEVDNPSVGYRKWYHRECLNFTEANSSLYCGLVTSINKANRGELMRTELHEAREGDGATLLALLIAINNKLTPQNRFKVLADLLMMSTEGSDLNGLQ
jgi:hypothetical protein